MSSEFPAPRAGSVKAWAAESLDKSADDQSNRLFRLRHNHGLRSGKPQRLLRVVRFVGGIDDVAPAPVRLERKLAFRVGPHAIPKSYQVFISSVPVTDLRAAGGSPVGKQCVPSLA